MFVGICEATFRAEWVSSLKEKRMVVKSLVEKTNEKRDEQNKKDALHQNYLRIFLRQEEHKMLVVGFACVSNEKSHAERMLQHILDFMEKSTEAELISAEYEVY